MIYRLYNPKRTK